MMNVLLLQSTVARALFRILAPGLACVTCLVGCSSPGPQRPVGQDSPRALLRKWHHAIVAGKAQEFVECCAPMGRGWGEAQKECMKWIRSVQAFKRALQDVHGADAWREYVTAAEKGGGLSVGAVPENDAWTREVDVEVKGDVATYLCPAGGFPRKLVRRGGIWYFDYEHIIVRDHPEEEKRWYAAHRAAVDKVTAEIRETKLSPEHAYRRLHDEMPAD